MIMKRIFNLAVLIFQIAFLSLFVSCDNPFFIGATGLYRVEFSVNGGTAVQSVRTDIIKEVPYTSRSDYTFGGWYLNSDFSGNPVSFPLDIKEDTTLYAKWFQEFTVTFETNGGDEIESYKTGIIPALPETSRTNYIFDGWYTKSDFSGNAVTFPYTVTKPVTLYAKWLRTYQVSFETNGGSEISGFRTAVIESVQDPVKDDNVFIGWYKDSAFKNPVEFPYTLTADTTLYAKWKQKYTVSFETNGGTNVSSYKAIEVESAPPVSRAGYAFIAWYTDIDLTEEAVFPFEVTRDTTLYAKWQKIYTVTFVTNGGTSVSPATVLTIETTPVSEKTDASLEGWYTDLEFAEGTKVVFPYTVTADITFYAKWQAVQYTITYNANGATGGTVPETIQVEKGSSFIVSANTGNLTKTGYAFTKWSTSTNGTSGQTYAPGYKLTPGSNMTLYAQWGKDYAELVTVDGGSFYLGDPNSGTSRPKITLSSFQIAKYELTYELWLEVYRWAQDKGYTMTSARKGYAANDAYKDFVPATNIRWNMACVWLNAYSEYKGLEPVYYRGNAVWKVDTNISGGFSWDKTKNGYRLPTECEWEFAGGGGDATIHDAYSYSGSNTIGDVAWYSSNSGLEAHPVGTKKANTLGIYDMSGNVAEWCYDYYADFGTGELTNPVHTSGSYREARGGSGYSVFTSDVKGYHALYDSISNKIYYRGGGIDFEDYYLYGTSYWYTYHQIGIRIARNAE